MGYLTKKELTRVVLPTDANYWVEIDTDFTYGDVKNIGTDLEGIDASDKFLTIAIKQWNLDDEAGKLLEITLDNINLLKKDDVLAIIAAVDGGAGDAAEKKDS